MKKQINRMIAGEPKPDGLAPAVFGPIWQQGESTITTKISKLLATMLTFTAAILLALPAWADEPAFAAEIDGVKYATIAEAIEAAGGDLSQITVLDPTAALPEGYEINSQTNLTIGRCSRDARG